jgi:hypothetical protein
MVAGYTNMQIQEQGPVSIQAILFVVVVKTNIFKSPVYLKSLIRKGRLSSFILNEIHFF